MKGILSVTLLGLIALMTLGITMDVNATTNRKNELQDTLTSSMWSTLKASSVNKMYDLNKQEMSAELLRNIAENVNTDSTFDVYIYDADVEGLLDVKLRSNFTHLNGEHDKREVRKTLILEKTPTE